MQSNIFVQAEPLLKAKKLNIDTQVLINYLGRYKTGDWIYPSALHRVLKLDIKSIYEALDICTDAGIIEQYLEIYCPTCQKFTGRYFKKIVDIPDEVYCESCDTEITDPLEHAIVIYRVK